ncbi:MAG: diphthine synthase [Nanoarchaeota archaeon]|nr:diphthine synthase [Nanoarchaeota archaeon]
MFYLVGLGLCGEQDLTLKSVEALKKCSEIFLENYTSLAPELNIKKLEKIVGKTVKKIGRENVEVGELITLAKTKKIGLIVIGDPLVATTHAELILECKEKNVDFEVFHNSSILTAVCETGLQAYKFGKTLSIPFHEADSFLKTLSDNQKIGAHTLCLLDLDLEKNEFLSVKQALNKLKGTKKAVVISLAGCKNQVIKFGDVNKLKGLVFKPPCSIIVPGKLHFKEEEFLEGFNV